MFERFRNGVRIMLLPTDIIAIIIALAGCLIVMSLFWKQNIVQQKEIRRLQLALRDERKK
jgi:uncharacterized integral membrane protein